MSNPVQFQISQVASAVGALRAALEAEAIDSLPNAIAGAQQALDKLNQGGFILIDNVLWSGKVLDTKYQDKDTALLRELNLKISQDVRVEKVLLPIRDGLYLIRKK